MESEEWSECVPFGDGFELPVMENSMEQSGTAKEKSLRFAVRIEKLYQYLCSEKTEYVLSKQVLRSGTSIGANLAEAETAVSKNDFLNKVYIALKECSETLYWLELLRQHRTIRLRHLLENLRPDFVTFS